MAYKVDITYADSTTETLETVEEVKTNDPAFVLSWEKGRRLTVIPWHMISRVAIVAARQPAIEDEI